MLRGYLSNFGEVELIELRPSDESRNFFIQCRRALKKVRAKIETVNFDLSGYDLICFGSPVWAFAPAPSLNTYLDNCRGIENKKIVLFTTYGSGSGNQKCLDYMQGLLSLKGVKDFQQFSLQQMKIRNREFVLAKIKESLPL